MRFREGSLKLTEFVFRITISTDNILTANLAICQYGIYVTEFRRLFTDLEANIQTNTREQQAQVATSLCRIFVCLYI